MYYMSSKEINQGAAAEAPQAAAPWEGGVKVTVVKDGVEVAHIVASPKRIHEMRVDSDTVKLFMDDTHFTLSVWVGYMLGVDVSFVRRECDVYLKRSGQPVFYHGTIKGEFHELYAPNNVVVRAVWL